MECIHRVTHQVTPLEALLTHVSIAHARAVLVSSAETLVAEQAPLFAAPPQGWGAGTPYEPTQWTRGEPGCRAAEGRVEPYIFCKQEIELKYRVARDVPEVSADDQVTWVRKYENGAISWRVFLEVVAGGGVFVASPCGKLTSELKTERPEHERSAYEGEWKSTEVSGPVCNVTV
jgi:hypothetical protein